jgi:hypothetical protein
LGEGRALKEKIENACRENPVNCDCSAIEQSEGRSQADSSAKSALSKCFRDVEKCDCTQLGLQEQSYVDFCQIQKSYGLNCKHEGTNCDKLENVEIYPAGMPPWLGKLFSKSYADYVNKEKEKGAKEAAGVITQCLNELVVYGSIEICGTLKVQAAGKNPLNQ